MKMKNSVDRFNNKLLYMKREQWTGRKVRRKYVKYNWKIQERCMRHRGCGKKSNICTTGVLKGKKVKNEQKKCLMR